MPIQFKSKLVSQVANDTFLDKTINDETIGILSLNEVLSGNSGSQVVNTQLRINQNTKIVFAEQVKAAASTITLDPISHWQEVRVSGSGGPVTLNTFPFTNAKVVDDGTEITIVGHSDANPVTIEDNTNPFGILSNGFATLQRGYTITYIYNDELELYIEKSRNF